jgi:hypothetical protein
VRTDTRDTSLLLLLLLVFAVGASGYVLREGMKEVSTTAILLYCYTTVLFICHIVCPRTSKTVKLALQCSIAN